MTNFVLGADENFRVTLQESAVPLALIKTIEAEPIMGTDPRTGEQVVLTSAWQVARAMVDESQFEHRPGHGFFLDEDEWESLLNEQCHALEMQQAVEMMAQ
jgi:hypothetical protein